MARWLKALAAVFLLAAAATAARKSPPKAEPQIEEVTAKQLDRVLEDKDFVAVYWYTRNAAPSPSTCEPPVIHIVSKMRESRVDLDSTRADNVAEYIIKEQEKCRQERMNRSRIHFGSSLTLSGEQIHDPAAKLLVASIKWLHGVPSFVQLKSTEQIPLLHHNWRELFLIAAAQYSYYFDEGSGELLRVTLLTPEQCRTGPLRRVALPGKGDAKTPANIKNIPGALDFTSLSLPIKK